jgi:hypothetical protein
VYTYSSTSDAAAAAARSRMVALDKDWSQYTVTPHCDEFGPPCLLAIAGFVRLLDSELAAAGAAGAAVAWVKSCCLAVSNACFLAGVHTIILRLDESAEAVARRVAGLQGHTLQCHFATLSPATFGLRFANCWR